MVLLIITTRLVRLLDELVVRKLLKQVKDIQLYWHQVQTNLQIIILLVLI